MKNTFKLLRVMRNQNNCHRLLNSRLNSYTRNYLKTWLGNVVDKVANESPTENSFKANQFSFISKYNFEITVIHLSLVKIEKFFEYFTNNALLGDFYLLDMNNVAGDINDYDRLKDVINMFEVHFDFILTLSFLYLNLNSSFI